MLKDKALNLLRDVSPYGIPLENHCLRLAEISKELCKIEQISIDEDLLYAACYLHDIGLCVKEPDEKNYLKRGLRYIQPKVNDWALSPDQVKFLEDVMLFSHSLPQMSSGGKEGDLVRRAVRVEHSFGRITEGLDRKTIKAIFKTYPRTGFNKVLLSFFRIALFEDSLKELPRIFFPRP